MSSHLFIHEYLDRRLIDGQDSSGGEGFIPYSYRRSTTEASAGAQPGVSEDLTPTSLSLYSLDLLCMSTVCGDISTRL